MKKDSLQHHLKKILYWRNSVYSVWLSIFDFGGHVAALGSLPSWLKYCRSSWYNLSTQGILSRSLNTLAMNLCGGKAFFSFFFFNILIYSMPFAGAMFLEEQWFSLMITCNLSLHHVYKYPTKYFITNICIFFCLTH